MSRVRDAPLGYVRGLQIRQNLQRPIDKVVAMGPPRSPGGVLRRDQGEDPMKLTDVEVARTIPAPAEQVFDIETRKRHAN